MKVKKFTRLRSLLKIHTLDEKAKQIEDLMSRIETFAFRNNLESMPQIMECLNLMRNEYNSTHKEAKSLYQLIK